MKFNVDFIYPVGSIYMSANSINPGTLFGGTWSQIKDRFLLAAGDTYSAGATGGEATHKLTASESGLPNHIHTLGMKPGSGGWTTVAMSDGAEIYTGYSGWSGSKDADQAHNNMPPYLVVYMWKRTS